MPPGVVTVTSTVPAASCGEVTVQLVVKLQLTSVAADPPKLAVVVALSAMKPVPVTVTTVPAASGPTLGLMAVTVGAAS